jgi:hypothetical protein
MMPSPTMAKKVISKRILMHLEEDHGIASIALFLQKKAPYTRPLRVAMTTTREQ